MKEACLAVQFVSPTIITANVRVISCSSRVFIDPWSLRGCKIDEVKGRPQSVRTIVLRAKM